MSSFPSSANGDNPFSDLLLIMPSKPSIGARSSVGNKTGKSHKESEVKMQGNEDEMKNKFCQARETLADNIRRILREMGDGENPHPQCVCIMEQLVTEYIINLTRAAERIGEPGRVITGEDVMSLVRKHKKKRTT